MNEYPDVNSLIECLISDNYTLREEAWSYFLKKYTKYIYKCLSKGLSYRATEEDKEDCFQEIIKRLLEDKCRRLRQFHSNNEVAFRCYLGLIAKRTAMRFNCGKIVDVSLTEEELAVIPDQSIHMDQETLRAEILDIINKYLPEQERLVMFFLEGFTLEEIADVMELKLAKVFEIKQKAFSIIEDILEGGLDKKN